MADDTNKPNDQQSGANTPSANEAGNPPATNNENNWNPEGGDTAEGNAESSNAGDVDESKESDTSEIPGKDATDPSSEGDKGAEASESNESPDDSYEGHSTDQSKVTDEERQEYEVLKGKRKNTNISQDEVGRFDYLQKKIDGDSPRG